jgi:hypothetical protein
MLEAQLYPTPPQSPPRLLRIAVLGRLEAFKAYAEYFTFAGAYLGAS